MTVVSDRFMALLTEAYGPMVQRWLERATRRGIASMNGSQSIGLPSDRYEHPLPYSNSRTGLMAVDDTLSCLSVPWANRNKAWPTLSEAEKTDTANQIVKPPKRRNAAASNQPKRARQSKLAKENDISAEEEFEIKEAFHMFSSEHVDYPDEKEGVIPTTDVRRALVALGLSPTDHSELSGIISAVDPDDEGYVTYEPFLAACALKLHSRTEDSVAAEVEHAYKLFTRGTNGPIQVSHLRKLARDLKQDISDDLLKDMVREANGGQGTHAGVNMEQFKNVMMRAGIF
ncbi:hypothetical protein KEM54_000615 [Ascosphaera aggregata]|nr:hypothetical protein KEM54_000615 [Ascosphaera aggregata]